MTPQEYFGTIQQSFVEVWKNHLETSKYSDHKALNDYYDDIVDAVDKLIEDYQGIYGKLGDLKNTMDTKIDDPIGYLSDLKKFVKTGRNDLIKEDDTEIWSDIDEVLSIIDSTLYKLKELGENQHRSLKHYLKESMNEGMFSSELDDYISNIIKKYPEGAFARIITEVVDAIKNAVHAVNPKTDWTRVDSNYHKYYKDELKTAVKDLESIANKWKNK